MVRLETSQSWWFAHTNTNGPPRPDVPSSANPRPGRRDPRNRARRESSFSSAFARFRVVETPSQRDRSYSHVPHFADNQAPIKEEHDVPQNPLAEPSALSGQLMSQQLAPGSVPHAGFHQPQVQRQAQALPDIHALDRFTLTIAFHVWVNNSRYPGFPHPFPVEFQRILDLLNTYSTQNWHLGPSMQQQPALLASPAPDDHTLTVTLALLVHNAQHPDWQLPQLAEYQRLSGSLNTYWTHIQQ